ncbi:Bgt-1222 [Blumeria graminis f. sp. tritici]|uniref:Bgt-1222 n=2 Tax=Blumeria graminis f. sp. tritici TaxID=62690 RepID=A0A061HHN6_BLUGR|nr:hypothetical protein BGT96224_1222 [Blumeria graminis f. sp. tritici 96224]VDB84056.1 Bgt-1222 [Blumeria graminis f. sp. tritici]
MPFFFNFQQGTETGGAANDGTPLLGRFRAHPPPNAQISRPSSHSNRVLADDLLPENLLRSHGVNYVAQNIEVIREDISDAGSFKTPNRLTSLMRDIWVVPKQESVKNLLDKWWSRWAALIVLPSALPVAWCAIPLPQYDITEDVMGLLLSENNSCIQKKTGYGTARVEINFWWPERVGLPLTITAIAVFSVIFPIPAYYIPGLHHITIHNTAWICWTFFNMSIPLILAITSLINQERYSGLRNPLSETQRIFSNSWWTDEIDSISRRASNRYNILNPGIFHPESHPNQTVVFNDSSILVHNHNLSLRKKWLPASFQRFIWFCSALFIAMLAYVMGEAYAESYLNTLPHSTYQTIIYVYTWVITVHLLDGIVGWILGGNNGERVGSYPLGWTFKLYFSLTYQTYVRALYARLRSPGQFLVLQVLSSSSFIILTPLFMWKKFHRVLTLLFMNNQSLEQYQKFCTRNIYIRSLAESVSMMAFLGSILVLHYGPNQDVYPYFTFDRAMNQNSSSLGVSNYSPNSSGDDYDFSLTFYASIVTFACEIVAAWIVRRIVWFGWHINVTEEAVQDLATWAELLPTVVVVMVHVLQNMLFSIIRLRFY